MPSVLPFAALVVLLAAPPVAQAEGAAYDIDYRVRFVPAQGVAEVAVALLAKDGLPTRLDFAMDPRRYTDVDGDGKLRCAGGRTIWLPPSSGGTLRYRYHVDRRRNEKGYDARITNDWTILRGDDLFPPARVRGRKDHRSRATLRFDLPRHWKGVDTQYPLDHAQDRFIVDSPDRRFVRPTGWIIAGDVAIDRERIGDQLVSVAAPRGPESRPADDRSADIFRYVRVTQPMLRQLGKLPPKLLIVRAGNQMWRGGLSASRSLWLHAERPLVNDNWTSNNGISTLLHELIHVVTRIRGTAGDDWIAEGIAEYYALELAYRAGFIDHERRQSALRWVQHRGRDVVTLRALSASGRRTARAVALFADLDRTLRERSSGGRSLDDVVQQLANKGGRTSLVDLRHAVEVQLGWPSPLLEGALVE